MPFLLILQIYENIFIRQSNTHFFWLCTIKASLLEQRGFVSVSSDCTRVCSLAGIIIV